MHLGWLKVIMPELANLAPVLTGKTVAVTAAPADRVALRITARQYKGKNFVFATNTRRTGLPISVVWPDKSVKSVKILGENRSVKVISGKIAETLEPYGVRIYTDDLSYPEGVDIPAVKAEIKAALKAAGR